MDDNRVLAARWGVGNDHHRLDIPQARGYSHSIEAGGLVEIS
jgi:hypothetical protein